MPQIPRRDRHALAAVLQNVKLTTIKLTVSVEGKLSTFRAVQAQQVSVLSRQNLVLSAHKRHPIRTRCLYSYICLFSDDTSAYVTVIIQAYVLWKLHYGVKSAESGCKLWNTKIMNMRNTIYFCHGHIPVGVILHWMYAAWQQDYV